MVPLTRNTQLKCSNSKKDLKTSAAFLSILPELLVSMHLGVSSEVAGISKYLESK